MSASAPPQLLTNSFCNVHSFYLIISSAQGLFRRLRSCMHCVRARHDCVAVHVRRGSSKETKGTAYVVYEDIYDAKTAVDHLSGFNVANRYLIVLYYNTSKQNKKVHYYCL